MKKPLISIFIITIYILIMLLPRKLFFNFPWGDNIGHIFILYILTIVLFHVLKKKLIFNFFFIILISTIVEIMQSFTSRNFSNYDLLYNILGILLGSISIYLFNLINPVKNTK